MYEIIVGTNKDLAIGPVPGSSLITYVYVTHNI